MIKNFKFNKSVVEWQLENEFFSINSNQIYMAYIDSENSSIVINTGDNFICNQKFIYDFKGILLSISDFSNNTVSIFLKKEEKTLNFENLLDTGFFYSQNIILILSELNNKCKKVTALNLKGEYLYDILPPNGFEFYYFSQNNNSIYIVCNGDLQHSDRFGRNEYKFKLDPHTGNLSNQTLAY